MKRPYLTAYYLSPRSKPAEWSRLGYSCSPQGAARAALGHLIFREFRLALIHDRATGVVIGRLVRERGRIVVIGV